MLFSLIRHRLARKQPILLLNNGRDNQRPLRTLVHVGAHLAQERGLYEQEGFQDILWIEGSPETYAKLAESFGQTSIAASARHRHHCALLTDAADQEVAFYKFNNQGASDSLFPSTSHMRQQWPGLKQLSDVQRLHSQTLDDVVRLHGLAGKVDVLVVDVQGAELLVLRGGAETLRSAQAVICEVSTKPFYDGGVLFPELREYLEGHGFVAAGRPHRSHCDLLFKRRVA